MADLEFNAGAALGRVRLNLELDSSSELALLEEINAIATTIFEQISAPAFSKQLSRFNAAQVGQELELNWLVAVYISFLAAVSAGQNLTIAWPSSEVTESLTVEVDIEKTTALEINKPEIVKHFCWWILFDYLQQRFPGSNFVIGDGNLHYSLGNWELPIVNPLTENEVYIQASNQCFVQLLQAGRNQHSTILLARGTDALKLAQLEKLVTAFPALPSQTIYDYCLEHHIELWELTASNEIKDLLMST